MRRAAGFTLVELVVVIMILGILAAVAVPKFIRTTKSANDAALRETLGVIRNAIDLFAADRAGNLPGADGSQVTFKSDVRKYLLSGADFPVCPVGAKNNLVRIQTSGTLLTGDASPTEGWAYDTKSGQFIANSNALSNDGTTLYHEY